MSRRVTVVRRAGAAQSRGWRGQLDEICQTAPKERPNDPATARHWFARTATTLLKAATELPDAIERPCITAPLPGWLKSRLDTSSIDSFYLLVTGRHDDGRQRLYQRIRDRHAALAVEVGNALREAGVRTIFAKGIELIPRFFGGQAVSTQSDIDILVSQQSTTLVGKVLRGIGFRQADYDMRTGKLVAVPRARIRSYEQSHIELYPFCRLTQFNLEPELLSLIDEDEMMPMFRFGNRGVMLESIDVHWNLVLGIDVNPLFPRMRASVVSGAETFSDTDHLWLLAMRFYLQATPGCESDYLRDLAYVAALAAHGLIDWPVLAEIAEAYDARPTLYYPLRLLWSLGLAEVPESVRERLHVHRGTSRLDHGCRASRALGWLEHPSADLLNQAQGWRR